jgi:hypothetical protein
MFSAAPRYSGQMQDALADIAELRRAEERVVVVTRQAERLADLLHEQNVYADPVEQVPTAPDPGQITLVDGILAEGWAYPAGRLIVLTDAEVFGWTRIRKRRAARPRRSAPETLFSDLKEAIMSSTSSTASAAIPRMSTRPLHPGARLPGAGIRLRRPADRAIHQADRVIPIGRDDREPYMTPVRQRMGHGARRAGALGA